MPQLNEMEGKIGIVVGPDAGDGGKGGTVDLLAQGNNVETVARYQGGDNASHTATIVDKDSDSGYRPIKFHMIPAGILSPQTRNILGQEVLITPQSFVKEYLELEAAGLEMGPTRVNVDPRSTMVMPWHVMKDALGEAARGSTNIGTTLKGMGPAYADRTARDGLRVGTLYQDNAEELITRQLETQERIVRALAQDPQVQKTREALRGQQGKEKVVDLLDRASSDHPFDKQQLMRELQEARELMEPLLLDTITYVRGVVANKRGGLLLEGANGQVLDGSTGEIDLENNLMYATSSHPGIYGADICFGKISDEIDYAVGATKAFTTRVGGGSFPGEIFDEDLANHLRGTRGQFWGEFGGTTGRPRRVGWFDSVLVGTAAEMAGLKRRKKGSLAIAKVDILAGLPQVAIVEGYKIGDQVYRRMPNMDARRLRDAQPVLRWFDGWEMPGADVPIRSRKDLPKNAQKYLKGIEETTDLPIKLISYSPYPEGKLFS